MGNQTRAERDVRRSDEQYTPIASAYVTSAIHAQGQDLPRMVELAGLQPGARRHDLDAQPVRKLNKIGFGKFVLLNWTPDG